MDLTKYSRIVTVSKFYEEVNKNVVPFVLSDVVIDGGQPPPTHSQRLGLFI